MKQFAMGKLLITRKCNTRCPYCIVPSIKTVDASHDDIMKGIEIINRWTDFLAIQGGEPTLSPNLDDVITYLAANRAEDSYVLVTNGLTLQDKGYRDHLKALGLESISVSHDSFKTWNESLIRDIVSEFKYITVCTIYDKSMIGNFVPMLEQLASLGVRIVANPVIWHHDDGLERWFTGPKNSSSALSKSDRVAIKKDIDELIEKYDSLDLITGKRFFSKILTYGFDMSWHCTQWTTLEVNNDLHVQFCQDLPESEYTIFDLDEKYNEMEQAHHDTTAPCNGCYNNCYTEIEFGKTSRM